MKEKDRKTPTVTTKLRATTKAQLKSQAKKAGLNFTEYVQELADRDSGFEAVEEIALPPKVLRHQESADEGFASGYVRAMADLVESQDRFGIDAAIAVFLLMESGVKEEAACEWDLRVIRTIDPSISRGRLMRDHPRAPKENRPSAGTDDRSTEETNHKHQ